MQKWDFETDQKRFRDIFRDPTQIFRDPRFSRYHSRANSPAFGGRLTLFCLVSRSPALVHKCPTFNFTSTVNIEYLVKNKTDLVWDLAHF